MSSGNSKVNFIYELRGGQNEIDVFELAPTLLALGQLIQESNRILYPGGQEIAVNVKPFREGSFIVDVVLFPASGIDQILDLVRHMSPHQIKELLITLGVIMGAAASAVAAVASVLVAIKELGHRPKRIERLGPKEYRYSVDDKSITVNGRVHQLMQSPVIINNINNVYAKPLEREGITAVESYLKDEPTARTVVVRTDAANIKQFASEEIEATARETTKETTTEGVYLNPKRGSFDGDGASWSFHKGDKVITATVKDQIFLDKVAKGDIRPNHKDLMTVTLTEKQKIIGTQVKAPSYEIVKVNNYQPGPIQGTLFGHLASASPDSPAEGK